eukprot:SAG11_NODE_5069_length_1673_cov_1.497143_1_plen_34_part_10
MAMAASKCLGAADAVTVRHATARVELRRELGVAR